MAPRLFVIGDSISLHYGPYLERFVAGRLEYARKTDELGTAAVYATTGATAAATASGHSLDYPRGAFGENAGDSGMVHEYLLARHASLAADVVLLNCGLHDLKTDSVTEQPQVALDDYRDNLLRVVEVAARSSFELVWVTTTPVHDETHAAHAAELGFGRCQADVERYNLVATAVMLAANVRVIDLHAFTRALGGGEPADLYVDHVHFSDRAREAQAAFLAGWLSSVSAGSGVV